MKILYVGSLSHPFVRILQVALRFPFQLRLIEPGTFDETIWRESFDLILLEEENSRYLLERIKLIKKSFRNNDTKVVVYADDLNMKQIQQSQTSQIDFYPKTYDPRIIRQQLALE